MQLKNKDIKPLRDKLLAEQNLICPLCKKTVSDPVLDHDHYTGKVRRVLCRMCNLLEGSITSGTKRYNIESPLDWLNSLIIYLDEKQTEYIHPKNKVKRLKKFKWMKKPEMIEHLESLDIDVPEDATRDDMFIIYRRNYDETIK